MTKKEQLKINEKVEAIFEEVYHIDMHERASEWKRLRKCSAYVCKFGRFYILKSYRTIVAAIDTCDDTCYDFLRIVYGYTPTSAQHIAKFRNDYGAGKCGCTNVLTWRNVKYCKIYLGED